MNFFHLGSFGSERVLEGVCDFSKRFIFFRTRNEQKQKQKQTDHAWHQLHVLIILITELLLCFNRESNVWFGFA